MAGDLPTAVAQLRAEVAELRAQAAEAADLRLLIQQLADDATQNERLMGSVDRLAVVGETISDEVEAVTALWRAVEANRQQLDSKVGTDELETLKDHNSAARRRAIVWLVAGILLVGLLGAGGVLYGRASKRNTERICHERNRASLAIRTYALDQARVIEADPRIPVSLKAGLVRSNLDLAQANRPVDCNGDGWHET